MDRGLPPAEPCIRIRRGARAVVARRSGAPQRQRPHNTWRKAGVDVTINTDHMFGLDPDDAMNPFNPFITLYTAITRRTESGQIIGKDEAVSREEALRMMTSTAARFSFDEKNRGSIETGKLGDFVVLSDHYMTCPEERLRSIVPEVTVIGGKAVFERRNSEL